MSTLDPVDLFYSSSLLSSKDEEKNPKTFFVPELNPLNVRPYITNPDFNMDELFGDIIKNYGPCKANIYSFNDWILNILPKEISAKSKTRNDKIYYYGNIKYLKPYLPLTNGNFPLFPAKARNSNLNYFFIIYGDAIEKDMKTNEIRIIKKYVRIGGVPCMLGSILCHLYGYTKEQLKNVYEDTLDPFGYFIREGAEKVILLQENLSIGKPFTILKKDTSSKGKSSSMMNDFDLDDDDEVEDIDSLNIKGTGGSGVDIVNFRNVSTSMITKTVVGSSRIVIESNKEWPSLHVIISMPGLKGNDEIKKFPILVVLDIILQFISPDYFGYDEELMKLKDYKTWYEANKKNLNTDFFELPKKEIGKGRANIIKVVENLISRFSVSTLKSKDFKVESKDFKVESKDFKVETDDLDEFNVIKNSLQPSISKYYSISSVYEYILKKESHDFDTQKKKDSQVDDINKINFNKILSFIETLFPSVKLIYKPELLIKLVWQHLACQNGLKSFDDRDSWDNKRVKMSYENLSRIIKLKLKVNIIEKPKRSDLISTDIVRTLGRNIATSLDDDENEEDQDSEKIFLIEIKDTEIDNSFQVALGSAGFDERQDSVEMLRRGNQIDPIAILSKLNPSALKQTRSLKLRYIHPTQMGFICPFNTPSGSTCGLSKNISCMTNISIQRNSKNFNTKILQPILDKILGVNVRNYNPKEGRKDCVILDGNIKAWCDSKILIKVLRPAAKTHPDFFDIEILDSPEERSTIINTYGNKLIRPVFKIDLEDPKLFKINSIKIDKSDLMSLIYKGAIEYITSAEQSRSTIAQTFENVIEIINKRKENPSVGIFNGRVFPLYCEIDPIGMVSVSTALMPYQNTCQGPRVNYQANMTTQALGNNNDSYYNRFDTSFKRSESCKPFTESRIAKHLGANNAPSGKMMMVAILALANNGEDGIVGTQETFQRFRTTKYLTEKFILKTKYSGGSILTSQKLCPPTMLNSKGEPLAEIKSVAYKCIDLKTGLPIIGSLIKEGMYLISTQTEIKNEIIETNNEMFKLSLGKTGIIEQVLVTEKKGAGKDFNLIIKIKIRQNKPVLMGDKLASRYSQKGTLASMRSITGYSTNMSYNYVDHRDLEENEGSDVPKSNDSHYLTTFGTSVPIVSEGPFKGMFPDIIINPHGQPRRMTPGMLVEMLASKASLFTGEKIDSTTFSQPSREKIEEWCDVLRRNGCDPDGCETMTHNFGGKEYKTKIFIAPCFYQFLKHVVLDKVQSRGNGKKTIRMNQPNRGKEKNGGIRNGEMEKAAMSGWGASALLLERFKISSDPWSYEICKNCGNQARVHYARNTLFCPVCNVQNQDIGIIDTTYISILINRVLLGMGIQAIYYNSKEIDQREIIY